MYEEVGTKTDNEFNLTPIEILATEFMGRFYKTRSYSLEKNDQCVDALVTIFTEFVYKDIDPDRSPKRLREFNKSIEEIKGNAIYFARAKRNMGIDYFRKKIGQSRDPRFIFNYYLSIFAFSFILDKEYDMISAYGEMANLKHKNIKNFSNDHRTLFMSLQEFAPDLACSYFFRLTNRNNL